MGYLEDRAARKNGLLPKLEFKKPKKPLKKVSDKKAAEMKANSGDSEMDVFFADNRKHMTGKCLFCSADTMKKDDEKFHFSTRPNSSLIKSTIVSYKSLGGMAL